MQDVRFGVDQQKKKTEKMNRTGGRLIACQICWGHWRRLSGKGPKIFV